MNAPNTILYKLNEVPEWDSILELWQSNEGTLPDVYLGLPLGAKYRCVSMWDPLIDRFRTRLALWKKRYLSFGGRLVLIKSTLQNLLVYLFSCRFIPVTVIDLIEKLIRGFYGVHRKEKTSYIWWHLKGFVYLWNSGVWA